MKCIAVRVSPVPGTDQWCSSCCICLHVEVSDSLRGAIMAARRHIKECKKPANNQCSHVLSKVWEEWIIGFM